MIFMFSEEQPVLFHNISHDKQAIYLNNIPFCYKFYLCAGQLEQEVVF